MPSLPSCSRRGVSVARHIADEIRNHAAQGSSITLGLATGSTPTGVYDELVRMHREEGLSLRNVITFNLDEYYPMQPAELQSYVRFMYEHLFDHVDIPEQNINIPGWDDSRGASHGLLPAIREQDSQRGWHRYSTFGDWSYRARWV